MKNLIENKDDKLNEESPTISIQQTLDNIIKGLKGFYKEDDFFFSKSILQDGRVSLYANSSFGIKVRMSNHSVLSISRILNEVHLASFSKCGSVENCIIEWKKYFNRFYGKK